VPQIEQLACPLREALGGKPPLAVPAPDGYEVLELIGIGGMGVVYKARQTGTEQLVALKLRPNCNAVASQILSGRRAPNSLSR
jgi:serine/threonine protein kinase